MNRIFLFSALFLFSFLCFAQQKLPAKIIGNIPSGGDKKYQIQVGAYKIEKNAEDAALRLRSIDLTPSSEKFLDFTRILVKGISANQVKSILFNIANAGFMEVIIREDTPSVKQGNSFTSSELLCKTWNIDNSPNPDLAGYQLFILNDGTYYVKNTKGESSSLSNWRWNGGSEFEYTHNDWEYYGRAEITKLTDNSLELIDSGYNYNAPGNSSAGNSNHWVFSLVADQSSEK